MIENVKDLVDNLESKIEECPFMKKIRKHSNVNPKMILIVMGLLMVIFFYKFDLFPTIALFIGIVIPMYRTNEAIKEENTAQLVHMGRYWVIFGLLSLLEIFRFYIMLVFPLYYVFKIIFIVMILLCNNNNGSNLEKAYTIIITPINEFLSKLPCCCEEYKPFNGVIPPEVTAPSDSTTQK